MKKIELIDAIQAILTDPFAGRGLSPNQKAAANCAALGFSIKEIAVANGISEGAAKSRLEVACKKLKLSKRELTKNVFLDLQSLMARALDE